MQIMVTTVNHCEPVKTMVFYMIAAITQIAVLVFMVLYHGISRKI